MPSLLLPCEHVAGRWLFVNQGAGLHQPLNQPALDLGFLSLQNCQEKKKKMSVVYKLPGLWSPVILP